MGVSALCLTVSDASRATAIANVAGVGGCRVASAFVPHLGTRLASPTSEVAVKGVGRAAVGPGVAQRVGLDNRLGRKAQLLGVEARVMCPRAGVRLLVLGRSRRGENGDVVVS